MATPMHIDSEPDSPIQPPPTPSAPGPRATALQKLYVDAIAHILKTCSYANFSSCFPTPARQVPGSVKLLHEQFTEKLAESMRKEFDAILRERDVVRSLNELDRLIEDAKRRKAQAAAIGGNGASSSSASPVPVAAHTLPPRQLYISHLAPTLAQYSTGISSRQEQLSKDNEEMMERVRKQREDIKRLIDGLEIVVEDLNGAVKTLNQVGQADGADSGLERAREETRAADEAMR